MSTDNYHEAILEHCSACDSCPCLCKGSPFRPAAPARPHTLADLRRKLIDAEDLAWHFADLDEIDVAEGYRQLAAAIKATIKRLEGGSQIKKGGAQ